MTKVLSLFLQEAQNSHVYWVSLSLNSRPVLTSGQGEQGRTLPLKDSPASPSHHAGEALALVPMVIPLPPSLSFSGATVSAWRIWTTKWCSSVKGTGGYSACLARWRPFVVGE